MRRFYLYVTLFMLVVFAGGCASEIYREILEGHLPGSYRTGRYYRRADDDARRYVRRIDRRLDLDRRQERRIERLLVDRTYYLLDQTHPADHRYVYPFPRREARRQDRVQRRWWQRTDRYIETRLMTRRQAAIYRDMVRYEDSRNRHRHKGKNKRRGRGRGHHRH